MWFWNQKKDKKQILLLEYKSLHRTVLGFFCLIFIFFAVIFFDSLFNVNILEFLNIPAGTLGILLSAMLASASMMKSIASSQLIAEENKLKDTSAFYLEKALIEINNIYELLKNQNNDRVTWILVARIIAMTKELSRSITEDHHKKVFELQEFQVKHKLREVLRYDAINTGLPKSFFSGLSNWKTASMDKVNNEISSIIVNNQIPVEAIVIVYDFIQFPKDFQDPLNFINTPKTYEELENWRNYGTIKDINHGAFLYIKQKMKV